MSRKEIFPNSIAPEGAFLGASESSKALRHQGAVSLPPGKLSRHRPIFGAVFSVLPRILLKGGGKRGIYEKFTGQTEYLLIKYILY